MNCITCKTGRMVPGQVTVSLTRGETLVVIKPVPAQICDNCGEYTLDANIAQRVYTQADAAAAHNSEVE